MTTKKSTVTRQLDKIRGGSLTFGVMIESLRICDEISQTELASRIKISKAHLCDIEKGRRAVTLTRAILFAKALGYPEIIFVEKALEDQALKAGLKYRITLKAA
jgi:transcriptional regulator with XRE-family HTH domain